MTEKEQPQNQFSIQKLYVKDISFESPKSPEIFTFQKWDPKIDLNLNSENKKLADNVFEVVLKVTATAKNEDKTAFLVEVQQAGIFQIQGYNADDTRYILGSQCMTILFPYAREVISDLTSRGGFPQLLLNPVNFDALFAQAMQQQKESQEEVKH